MTKFIRALATLVALTLSSVALSQPQPYPSRPIKLVHGFQPGGPPDLVARQLAAKLEPRLGVAVVVENRPGAAGMIAAGSVARAEPDGHTLLFGVAANLVVAPVTMKTPPYDARAAFSPIAEVARGAYVWLVRADAPVTTMREFIAWAKSQPGKLNYASPGRGTVHHLATEMLKRDAGIDLVHVPFKQGLYNALLAGEVQGMFESMPGPLPHLAAGKVRALAVTGSRRLPALPDVPTLAEQGLQEPQVNSWWGIVGPAALPAPIVARLNAEIATALDDPELRATLAQWNIVPSRGTPEAFGAYIASEWTRWTAVVERTGLGIE